MAEEEDSPAEGFQCGCGGDAFADSGYYFCRVCNSRVEGITETDDADEGLVNKDGGGGGLYNHHSKRRRPSAKEEPHEATKTKELSYEDYFNEVRCRYVSGIQRMIQLQCEALVENFNASPLICGVASAVWLRFLVTTEVFQDTWADETLMKSEPPEQGGESTRRNVHHDEPCNASGQRAVMVWFRRLREVIPLDHTLAISFLACHVAREAILPTDIVKWSVEGKLPYFGAHVEIVKRFAQPSLACPISPALMFRPSQPIPVQKLEAMAARIAKRIGLNLPPVNFYAVASRYLDQLSVPGEKILPHACRIYEWSMPPDLWLSTNELRIPTRVCAMAILVVSIRILYNLNGFGAWERSLCLSKGSSEIFAKSEGVQTSGFDSEELLQNLEAEYNEIEKPCEFTKDLTSYLRYCKDMVFAGAWSSSHSDQLEIEELKDKLWDSYQNAEEDLGTQGNTFNPKRSRSDDASDVSTQSATRSATRKFREMGHERALQDRKNGNPSKEAAVRKLKSDMEDDRFCYIPPRVKVKESGYLQYTRKQDEGVLRYVAHADYYILLRSCAKVAGVDVRIMHIAVLGLERRLAWLEKRIDHCLHSTPPSISCDFCRGDTASH
ncbi:unnamed protein product [Linum trigynum]|uniref:Rrn7/TAF1B N-terminal cyclin domain-containing protein n=1 Tax=Linum trigynum TaxID=586398 RepID=A0AAV2DIS5_9ROSI